MRNRREERERGEVEEGGGRGTADDRGKRRKERGEERVEKGRENNEH